MRWGRRAAYPEQVTRAAGDERVLAAASSGTAWLVATMTRFVAVSADSVVWDRPWHEVEAAAWGREASELTVTFVGGGRPVILPLGFEERFLQILRDRVDSSVVATREVPLDGSRKARAVIRRDLTTGELLEQVAVGRGTRQTPAVDALARVELDRLREELGMPPRA